MLAYLILAHKNSLQVKRLLEAVFHEQNIYFIHYDSKATDFAELQQLLLDKQNVYFLPRISATWAGFSLVKITLDAINYALNMNENWTQFILLSGQDYPLKKQTDIMNYLEQNPGNYIHYSNTHDIQEFKEQRFLKEKAYAIEVNNEMKVIHDCRPTFEEHFPGKTETLNGSQWFILDRAFCTYLANEPIVEKYKHYFAFYYGADEAFFQTAFWYSPHNTTIKMDYKRFVLFESSQHHPEILTMKHFPIFSRTDNLFARKFDISVDSSVLDHIDRKLSSIEAVN